MKYKLMYSIEINGEKVGYISSKENFEESINKEILETNEENVEFVSINIEPNYKIKLVNRNEETSESKILACLKENTTTTYKFYEVALNDNTKTYVDTLEEATNLVNKIKEEHSGETNELNLQIVERYTNNKEEVKTDSIETAENDLSEKINTQLQLEKYIAKKK